jgi:hypothetical protein
MPGTVYIQILGAGSKDVGSSVLIFTDTNILFNMGGPCDMEVTRPPNLIPFVLAKRLFLHGYLLTLSMYLHQFQLTATSAVTRIQRHSTASSVCSGAFHHTTSREEFVRPVADWR